MDKHLQEVLDALPDSLQEIIKPKLEAAEQHYTGQLNEAQEALQSYEPFKIYLENNIDAAYVEQAVRLADELQREPDKVITQISDTWNLGFISKEEAEKLKAQTNDDWGSDDPPGNEEDDPRYKELLGKFEELQNKWEEQQNSQQYEDEVAQFEAQLDELEAKAKEENKPFNRLFVTALVAQADMELDEAVNEFYKVIGQEVSIEEVQNQNDEGKSDLPPVLGGNGSGSGSPDGTVNFGTMSKDDLNATVERLLAEANNQ